MLREVDLGRGCSGESPRKRILRLHLTKAWVIEAPEGVVVTVRLLASAGLYIAADWWP